MDSTRTVVIGGDNYGLVLAGDNNIILQSGELRVSSSAPRNRAEFGTRLLRRMRQPAAIGRRSIISWLSPTAGVVPQQSRTEVQQLRSWVLGDDEATVRLVTGQGGQGKTTLAMMLCEALADDNVLAGFLSLPSADWKGTDGPDRVVALQSWLTRWGDIIGGLHGVQSWPDRPDRILLVIDYAENQADGLADLLTQIAHPPSGPSLADQVRILCLARSTGDWWQSVATDHPEHDLVDELVTDLPALTAEMDADRRREFWRLTVRAFAAKIANTTAPAVDPPLMPDIGINDEVESSTDRTTLEFVAAALLAVLDHAAADNPAPVGNPLVGVMNHERRLLRQTFRAAGLELSPRQLSDTLLVAYLARPSDLAAGERLLKIVPSLATLDHRKRQDLAAELAGTYPSSDRLWSAPIPDAVPDTHVLTCLDTANSAPDVIRMTAQILTAEDSDQHQIVERAARILSTSRARQDFPTGTDRFTKALEEALTTSMFLLWLGVRLAVKSLAGPIRNAINAASTDSLVVAARLHNDTSTIPINRAELLAAVHRELMRRAAGGDEFGHAIRVSQLAMRLGQAGDNLESIRLGRQALSIFRRRADSDADHRRGLTTTLYNLAASHIAAGQTDAAMEAMQEYWQLFQSSSADSTESEPDLVERMSAASQFLAVALTAGRVGGEIQPVVQELLDGLRVIERDLLSRGISTVEDVRVAEVVGNAYNHLTSAHELGQVSFEGDDADLGLVFARNTVAVRDALYRYDPKTYLSQYADALGNEGSALLRRGLVPEAIRALEESVRLQQELVGISRRTYVRALAIDLGHLADAYQKADRQLDAQTTATLAADAWRTQEVLHGSTFRPQLATALIRVAALHSGRGDSAAAIRQLDEAIGLVRGSNNPSALRAASSAWQALAEIQQRTDQPGQARIAAMNAREAAWRLPPGPEMANYLLRSTATILEINLSSGDLAAALTSLREFRTLASAVPGVDADSNQEWLQRIADLEAMIGALQGQQPTRLTPASARVMPVLNALDVARRQDDLDEETAEAVTETAERYLAGDADPDELIDVAVLLSEVYLSLDRPESALRAATAGTRLATPDPGSTTARVICHIDVAKLTLAAGGDPDTVRHHARAAFELIRQDTTHTIDDLRAGAQLVQLSSITHQLEDDTAGDVIAFAVESIVRNLGRDQRQGTSQAFGWLSTAIAAFTGDQPRLIDLSERIADGITSDADRAFFYFMRGTKDMNRPLPLRAIDLARALRLAAGTDDLELELQTSRVLRDWYFEDPAVVGDAIVSEHPPWMDIPADLIARVEALVLSPTTEEQTALIEADPTLLSDEGHRILDEIGLSPQAVPLLPALRDLIETMRGGTDQRPPKRIEAEELADFVTMDADDQDRFWQAHPSTLDPELIAEPAEGPPTPAHRRAHAIAALTQAGVTPEEADGLRDPVILLKLLRRAGVGLSPADTRYLAETAYEQTHDDQLAAECGGFLAWTDWQAGNVELATHLLREAEERSADAVGRWLAWLDGADATQATALSTLLQGDFSEADEQGEPSLTVLSSYESLTRATPAQLAAVITQYEQALAAPGSLMVDTFHNRTALRNNLAGAYRLAGRARDAITQLELLVDEVLTRVGPRSRDYVLAATNLTLAYGASGHYPNQALRLLGPIEDVAESRPELFRRGDIARVRTALGNSYLVQGNHESAIRLLERVRSLEHDADERLALDAGIMLAHGYLGAQRSDDAIALLERLVIETLAVWGPEHPQNLVAATNLMTAYLARDRTAEAVEVGERLLPQARQRFSDSGEALTLASRLAEAQVAEGRYTDAVELLRELLRSPLIQSVENQVVLKNRLGQALHSGGSREEAVEVLSESARTASEALGDEAPLTRQAHQLLAAAQGETS